MAYSLNVAFKVSELDLFMGWLTLKWELSMSTWTGGPSFFISTFEVGECVNCVTFHNSIIYAEFLILQSFLEVFIKIVHTLNVIFYVDIVCFC